MIYFIESESGHIKIGHTDVDVKERLKAIQTCCPFKLKLLKTIDGNYKKEKEIHKLFKYCRFRGEWFHKKVGLIKFIHCCQQISWKKELTKNRKINCSPYGGMVIKQKKLSRLMRSRFNQILADSKISQ